VTALYDDLGPPVLVRGYAAVFGCTYAIGDGVLERISPGAFTWHAGQPPFLAFGHGSERLAWCGDRSLSVWQDVRGVAFEAALPSNWAALGVANGIVGGAFRSCSIAMFRQQVECLTEGGCEVQVVHRAELQEISIAPAGANPAACCWLADELVEDLPPGLASACALWAVGKMQAEVAAARRPAARARAAAAAGLARAAALREARAEAVPASVVAVLDRYGLPRFGR
jgi:hypothetical protein